MKISRQLSELIVEAKTVAEVEAWLKLVEAG